jgi:hypothetical protein
VNELVRVDLGHQVPAPLGLDLWQVRGYRLDLIRNIANDSLRGDEILVPIIHLLEAGRSSDAEDGGRLISG